MPRKLVYYVACTLDGFIARPDGGFDGFLFGGEHFAELIERFPETFPAHLRPHFGVPEKACRFDTVLMGRHTYEVGLREGVTNPYRPLRQIVVSRSMMASPDEGVELWGGSPAELLRGLRQESGGDIWLCGGAQLAGALLDEIDEFVFKVNPVVFGSGIPLFAGIAKVVPMRPLEHKAFANGFVLARYEPMKSSDLGV